MKSKSITPPLASVGIDLGSNSFRLLIARETDSGILPLHKELVTVRLGEGLLKTGRISDAALERASAALAFFKNKLSEYNISTIRACGTMALRKAVNSSEFLLPATELLGTHIAVISGREEALLSFSGSLLSLDRSKITGPLLYADVGGGSTEIVISPSSQSTPQTCSIEAGAVVLTESFLKTDPPESKQITEASAFIRKSMTPVFNIQSRQSFGRQNFIGSGGTATALAALALKLQIYDEKKVQGFILTKATLHSIIGEISRLSACELNQIPCLDQKRGEIILAGGLIYRDLLEMAGCGEMTVSDAGLLEGILLSGLSARGKPVRKP